MNCDELGLSFAGCGFLGIYHIGVASCLQLSAPQVLSNKIGGSSAGALCALTLACDIPLVEVTRLVLSLAMEARKNILGAFSPSFELTGIIRRKLESLLPNNVAEMVSGKFFVSITKTRKLKNLLVSEFHDKNDVIEAVLASSFVPVMSGFNLPKFRGKLSLDGIYSDALPLLGDFTITVSPFAGDVSISTPEVTRVKASLSYGSGGSFHVSKNNLCKLRHALIPPSILKMKSLCEQGFRDARRFLLSEECTISNVNKERIEGQCELPQDLSEVFNEFF